MKFKDFKSEFQQKLLFYLHEPSTFISSVPIAHPTVVETVLICSNSHTCSFLVQSTIRNSFTCLKSQKSTGVCKGSHREKLISGIYRTVYRDGSSGDRVRVGGHLGHHWIFCSSNSSWNSSKYTHTHIYRVCTMFSVR